MSRWKTIEKEPREQEVLQDDPDESLSEHQYSRCCLMLADRLLEVARK